MRSKNVLVALGLLAFSAAAAAAFFFDSPDAEAPPAAISRDLHVDLGSGKTEPDASVYETALNRLNDRLKRYPDDHEASLLKSLVLFKSGRMGEAMVELNALTSRAPQFHLAHLIRGDLLLAKAQAVQEIGGGEVLAHLPARQDGLNGLRTEAEVRLKAYLDGLPRNRIPSSLLVLGGSVKNAIVVDKGNHRLYIYQRTREGEPPRLVRDFYVSTGKLIGNKASRGDLRTPEGVYFITGHIPRDRLPDKYGIGAFPTNYPNEYDRRLGKTGDGIWLHGTEAVYYSRPPLDSEGCVVLPNQDLTSVGAYIEPGVTPMIITERVQWLELEEWVLRRAQILGAIESWRRDWESRNVERYLSHYAHDFWSEDHDLRSWSERKRRVAEGKTFQQVAISDISAFAYPAPMADGRELVVVNFQQDYHSNNLSSKSGKRLYLAKGQERWQVVYEGQQ